ncbi:MAG: hypothetical protein ACRDID_11335, partial [Ktedonobacterales bacterium]
MRWNARWQRWRHAPAVVALVLVAGCASSTTARVTPTASVPSFTPTATVVPAFPSFSDWRIAYINQDGRLHAVSLDGKRDSVGSALPFAGVAGDAVWAAGVSPDGQRLAYLSDNALTIVDAATGDLRASPVHTGDSRVWWSPDQRYLALSGG